MNAIVAEYKGYRDRVTSHSRSNVPDMAALKTNPFRWGAILKSLSIWDPYARPYSPALNRPIQLANERAAFEEIEDVLNDHKVWPYGYYLGKGGAAVVARIRGEKVVRLTSEDSSARIKSEHVLQAEESAVIGNTGLRYEILRLADERKASPHHVTKIQFEMAREGNFLWDSYSDNLGFVDNKIKVLDGGASWSQPRLLADVERGYSRCYVDMYVALRRQIGLPDFRS